jgi:hypothetical protein
VRAQPRAAARLGAENSKSSGQRSAAVVPRGRLLKTAEGLLIIEPTKKSGEGILRTAEALAKDPYWDAIMEQIQRSRRVELRPQGSLE